MIEELIAVDIAVSLAQMGILLFIATKIAVLNDITHLMHDLLIDIRGRLK